MNTNFRSHYISNKTFKVFYDCKFLLKFYGKEVIKQIYFHFCNENLLFLYFGYHPKYLCLRHHNIDINIRKNTRLKKAKLVFKT